MSFLYLSQGCCVRAISIVAKMRNKSVSKRGESKSGREREREERETDGRERELGRRTHIHHVTQPQPQAETVEHFGRTFDWSSPTSVITPKTTLQCPPQRKKLKKEKTFPLSLFSLSISLKNHSCGNFQSHFFSCCFLLFPSSL